MAARSARALARDEPVRTILSGPAAGVVGAAELVRAMGVDRFITFDMGGTSTDVSLFDGRAAIRTLSYPGGYAVRTPVIDIHTVGAGGGSIAAVDAGGSLKVGPESAGRRSGARLLWTRRRADGHRRRPGRRPAGGREFPGRRDARFIPSAPPSAIAGLGRAMSTDAIAAARGVIRVVNANMERAIRVITVERGFDPRDFALMAFGGAGPMHACELALDLGIRHIVLPRNPGLLCAWGALQAPLGREYSLTVREASPNYRRLAAARASDGHARARRELAAEGARPAQIRIELCADVRYRGQSYEIEVRARLRASPPTSTPPIAAPSAMPRPRPPVEVVNLRLRATAPGAAVAPSASRTSGRQSPARAAHQRRRRRTRARGPGLRARRDRRGRQDSRTGDRGRTQRHRLCRARVHAARRRLRQPAPGGVP